MEAGWASISRAKIEIKVSFRSGHDRWLLEGVAYGAEEGPSRGEASRDIDLVGVMIKEVV